MGEEAAKASKSQPAGKGGASCYKPEITDDEWQKAKCEMLEKLQKKLAGQKTGDGPFDNLPDYTSAVVFDHPRFWGNGQDVNAFRFQGGPQAGQVLTGAQVNYYFQGMIAKGFGMPRGLVGIASNPNLTLADNANTVSPGLEGIIRGWKQLRYGEQPDEKTLEMARAGYDNYEKDLAECKKAKAGGGGGGK